MLWEFLAVCMCVVPISRPVDGLDRGGAGQGGLCLLSQVAQVGWLLSDPKILCVPLLKASVEE